MGGSDGVAGRSYAAWLVDEVFPGFGAREAVVYRDVRMTYTELAETIRRMATAFRSLGLGPGTTIALASGNRAEAVCVPFAAHLAGARFLPMPVDRGPAEYASVAANAPADALIVDDRISETCADAVTSAFPGARLWSLGSGGPAPDLMDAVRRARPADDAEWADAGQVETVLCSGGTTGLTKSILHRHRMYRTILAHPFLPEPVRLLVTSQVAHVGGLYALTSLAQGSTLTLLDRFTPEAVIEALKNEPITAMMLMPPMLYRLLDHPALAGVDCSRLRRVMYGASPITPDRLQQALDRFGPVLWQLYAQTEAFGLTALDSPDHLVGNGRLLRSVGRAFPDMETDVRDDQGRTLPPGEVGEICARGPRVMECYLNQPEATAAAFHPGGWLRTGDLGYRDEEGYFFLMDRRNDVIITGEAGSTIYSPLVENALTTHPAVRAAAVIPVPHPFYGQAVHAVVVTAPGTRVELDELRKCVLNELERPVYLPASFEFVDALPLTPIGKVDKTALRTPYWAGHQGLLHGDTTARPEPAS
ncbi:AMP-binding protein [Streptomyces sp. UNOB3_S3]|uniref:AMP-binding protein n=1 Tax=Streptomyces sp. UNOB3_S3 TaxID=2871682 RepID=UPI001E2A6176|nr:AMP-binding protein [Streptomyces sp. UNOB3_S3]MCC3774750.1 AMP-binding protein [Streptomyces sp. UNOB3_S3]